MIPPARQSPRVEVIDLRTLQVGHGDGSRVPKTLLNEKPILLSGGRHVIEHPILPRDKHHNVTIELIALAGLGRDGVGDLLVNGSADSIFGQAGIVRQCIGHLYSWSRWDK